jgi:hypothetical protein
MNECINNPRLHNICVQVYQHNDGGGRHISRAKKGFEGFAGHEADDDDSTPLLYPVVTYFLISTNYCGIVSPNGV